MHGIIQYLLSVCQRGAWIKELLVPPLLQKIHIPHYLLTTPLEFTVITQKPPFVLFLWLFSCNLTCDFGKYGVNCAQTCPCHDRNCNPVSGACNLRKENNCLLLQSIFGRRWMDCTLRHFCGVCMGNSFDAFLRIVAMALNGRPPLSLSVVWAIVWENRKVVFGFPVEKVKTIKTETSPNFSRLIQAKMRRALVAAQKNTRCLRWLTSLPVWLCLTACCLRVEDVMVMQKWSGQGTMATINSDKYKTYIL